MSRGLLSAPEPIVIVGLRCSTDEGAALPPFAVHLRGHALDDVVLAAGDELRFPPGWRPGRPLDSVENLTTGVSVDLRSNWRERLPFVGR